MDGCSNDKTLEDAVISYKERQRIITSELDVLKKELTLEQERRRNVETELTNTKEYEEKLLVEGRKSDSLMIQMSTNAHYDAEKLAIVTAKYDALCEENQLLQAKLQDLNNIEEELDDEGDSPSSSNAAADDGQHDGHVTNL